MVCLGMSVKTIPKAIDRQLFSKYEEIHVAGKDQIQSQKRTSGLPVKALDEEAFLEVGLDQLLNQAV